MPLEITVARKGPGAFDIALRGRLDTETSPLLERRLDLVFADAARRIRFDLAGLDYISSMGLRALMRTAKRTQAAGGEAVLVNPQVQVRKVVEIARALPKEAIFTSIAEADAYFDAMQEKALRDAKRR